MIMRRPHPQPATARPPEILEALLPLLRRHSGIKPPGQRGGGGALFSLRSPGSGRIGSNAMQAKLSEALFVDTLRRYIARLPEWQTGWLRERAIPSWGEA